MSPGPDRIGPSHLLTRKSWGPTASQPSGRGLVTGTTGPEGEMAVQYQSVALSTKSWYYSAGIKYHKLLACMQILDNTDKSVRQRYPATYFVYDLHLSGCQREFDGGQLNDSMAVRYAMRCGCGHLAPCLRGWKPSNRNHHGVAEAHVVGR